MMRKGAVVEPIVFGLLRRAHGGKLTGTKNDSYTKAVGAGCDCGEAGEIKTCVCSREAGWQLARLWYLQPAFIAPELRGKRNTGL